MRRQTPTIRIVNPAIMASPPAIFPILPRRWGLIFALSASAALSLAVGTVSLLEAVGAIELPLALLRLAEKLPIVFPLHMGFSALALILIVPTLWWRRRPVLHRRLGRLTLVCVAIGGVTAFPSAVLSEADIVTRLGFGSQALVWLACAGLGFAAARAGRLKLHRAAMSLMVATTSGAVLLRLMLTALAWLGEDTSQWYGLVAWAAWLLPIAVVWAWLTVGKRVPFAHKGRNLLPLPGR